MTARLKDRYDAGRKLARALDHLRDAGEVIVLGLPRGGVPVAYEVATYLGAPLDVFVVRKLGVPGHEELALGAIATGGTRVVNDDVVDALGLSDDAIERVAARETREIERREALYRQDRPPLAVAGKTVIVVDDGLATGATMLAAVKALRTRQPARIVVAVPVAPPDTCARLAAVADEVVCPTRPEPFYGVGIWYTDFDQTSDREVTDLMVRLSARRGLSGPAAAARAASAVRTDRRPDVPGHL